MARAIHFFITITALLWVQCAAMAQGTDPLPSWNEGAAKSSILTFVNRVTKPSSPDFVPERERIATFDNDGTLWAEQPIYFQLLFALERVKELAPKHPEWRRKEPFASLLKGDVQPALKSGQQGFREIIVATHSGMTTEEFERIVNKWIIAGRHPTSHRPYTEMVYQPMLELLKFLRSKGFKTFIVSGGGIDFMRPWVERVYGIPPEQVVGSTMKITYQVRDGVPVLIRNPEVTFMNDKEGKPVGIHNQIGRRPIAAFGNSDGDFQMLEWSTSGKLPGFGLVIHHTDEVREWSYDRKSDIGRLDKGLDVAQERGWTVVDMKRDWKVVFPSAE